jgi:hypothetical protein
MLLALVADTADPIEPYLPGRWSRLAAGDDPLWTVRAEQRHSGGHERKSDRGSSCSRLDGEFLQSLLDLG